MRSRALLLEEGFDEGLGATIQPIRWMIASNARRTAARFRVPYPAGLVGSLRMALFSAFLRLDMRRKHGSRALDAPPPATLLSRLGELLDILDAALAETGWLAEPAPSVADFALYGWLVQLDGLDGWDAVRARQRVTRLIQLLSEPAQQAAGTAEDGSEQPLGHDSRRAQRASEPPPSP